MRFILVAALTAGGLTAAAEPPHPPASPPKAPAQLRPPSVDQPAHALVIATGDFDGDGRQDAVERIPGAHPNSLRIQVRRAAQPDNPYFIMEGSPRSDVEAMLVKVGQAGVYVVDKLVRTDQGKFTARPDPTSFPSDVVLVRLDRPTWHGFMLKYWSESSDGFVGLNWPDPDITDGNDVAPSPGSPS